jgi:16S rRNA (guanine(966)-N(2))-methyltransferase RsmD
VKRSGAPGAVRIQGGKWKGRKLEVPADARPTSGRARAALFDVLGPERLRNARVLDVFAGSGAVGFEAVSRGASAAVLVEADARSIARTCARLSIPPEEIRVLSGDARAALAGLARNGETFDLVFADPPYGAAAAEVTRTLDGAAGLLSAGGVLIVQTDAGETPPPPRSLRAAGLRSYGRNVFHFYGIL